MSVLYNLRDAAAWLGVSSSGLRQKLHAGLGPDAVRLPGSSHWRFRLEDLERYLTDNLVPAVDVKPRPAPPSVQVRLDKRAAKAVAAAAGQGAPRG